MRERNERAADKREKTLENAAEDEEVNIAAIHCVNS